MVKMVNFMLCTSYDDFFLKGLGVSIGMRWGERFLRVRPCDEYSPGICAHFTGRKMEAWGDKATVHIMELSFEPESS